MGYVSVRQSEISQRDEVGLETFLAALRDGGYLQCEFGRLRSGSAKISGNFGEL